MLRFSDGSKLKKELKSYSNCIETMYLLFRYAKPSNPCSILLNFALLSRIVVSGEPNSIVQKSNDKPNIENYALL